MCERALYVLWVFSVEPKPVSIPMWTIFSLSVSFTAMEIFIFMGNSHAWGTPENMAEATENKHLFTIILTESETG